ncbi:MAG TPA: sigma-70 family RNA polymerase sigma factor [Candidatus Dormibacteraeota bacterium]|nr:sigma-70 family RNA polymerase sigma factor [Candidatus Dormibacteraeota bacterium]
MAPFDLTKDGQVSSLPTRGDERGLVERAKEDPGAFGELYDRYFLQIYRFVYTRVRDQAVAEDVTSEVFMKALRAIGRYQDTGRPFSAWLYQIAVNAVADSFRASRPSEDIDEQHDLSDGASLEETAAQRDELRRIWRLVERLPRPQRTAMVLKFQHDMKIEDIASAMGKSPGAVKLLIHRGTTRVRGQVGPTEGLETALEGADA